MSAATDVRFHTLQQWLQSVFPATDLRVVPLAGDASFRRYFRVHWDKNSAVAMDAPTEKEDLQPFIKVAEGFATAGLQVPKILAADLTQGFLLLSDLGDELYLNVINADNVEQLYGKALSTLVQLQSTALTLPPYDNNLLMKEMMLFPEWYLTRHLNLDLSAAETALIANTFEQLTLSALQQPQVCVHRDYHSRNLLQLEDSNVGILDFQDAVRGPVSYDVVSLLRDCYIAWPREQVEKWAASYLQQAIAAKILPPTDVELFLRWFDWMGLQRHLKCAGIFVRLFVRDNKPGYLPEIPRLLNYITDVTSRYPELETFHQFLQDRVLTR